MALAEILARNQLKQKDVAEWVGVQPETLSRWVRGHIVPGGTNLVRLLEYLRQFEPTLTDRDILRPDDGAVMPAMAAEEPSR